MWQIACVENKMQQQQQQQQLQQQQQDTEVRSRLQILTDNAEDDELNVGIAQHGRW